MNTEAEFKAIPRLRWHLDEDGCPIAKTRSRRNPKDHLYFHGPGVLGLYYERETQMAATYARQSWERRVEGRLVRTLAGDFDGTVLFRASGHEDVPRAFLRSTRLGYAARAEEQADAEQPDPFGPLQLEGH